MFCPFPNLHSVIPDANRRAGILVMHTCTMAGRRYTPSSAISEVVRAYQRRPRNPGSRISPRSLRFRDDGPRQVGADDRGMTVVDGRWRRSRMTQQSWYWRQGRGWKDALLTPRVSGVSIQFACTNTARASLDPGYLRGASDSGMAVVGRRDARVSAVRSPHVSRATPTGTRCRVLALGSCC